MLHRKCQVFLFDTLKTAQDVFSFMLDTYNNFPEADPKLLHELLRENAEKCQNCLKPKVACMDKKMLVSGFRLLESGKIEAIRVGLLIKQSNMFSSQGSRTRRVTELCYKAQGTSRYTNLTTFAGTNYSFGTMFLRLESLDSLPEVRMTIVLELYMMISFQIVPLCEGLTFACSDE